MSLLAGGKKTLGESCVEAELISLVGQDRFLLLQPMRLPGALQELTTQFPYV